MVGMVFNAPAVIDTLNWGCLVRSSRTDMMDELYLAQEDGGLPTTLAAGSAPGEAASPSSACGSEAAYISARQRNSTLSGFKCHRRPAMNAA
jgi:hypothetical protein